MITIAVAASKGGVGKTTLTAALAVRAMKDGGPVVILDWEPQGSLSLWWVMRGKPSNPRLIRDAGDPVKEIEKLAGDHLYAWAFLDTAPAGVTEIERAIEAADFVLVPCVASVFDLSAVRTVVAICEELDKPFAFVLSREQTDRHKLNSSALVNLKKLGPVLAEHVQERTAYVSATGLGKTGPEHPDSRQAKPAREEIEALWAAVKRLATKAARVK